MNGQLLAFGSARDLIRSSLNSAENILNGGKVALPFLGEREASIESLKKADLQVVFKVVDSMTDRRSRDVQLFGRVPKAHPSPRGLEGL
jgi:hypothetical protein